VLDSPTEEVGESGEENGRPPAAVTR
jgi:hypothetical protein